MESSRAPPAAAASSSPATSSSASAAAVVSAADPNTEFHALLHDCTVSSWRQAIALADEPNARARINTSRPPAKRVGAVGGRTDSRETQYAIALWLKSVDWSLDDPTAAAANSMRLASAAEWQQIVNRVFDILMQTGSRPLLRRSIIAHREEQLTPLEWIAYAALVPQFRCVLRRRTAGGSVDLFATRSDAVAGRSGANPRDSVTRMLHYALASTAFCADEFKAAEVDGADTATVMATATIAAGGVELSHSLACELIRRAIDTYQYDVMNAVPHGGSALICAIRSDRLRESELLFAAPPPLVELDAFDPPSRDGLSGGCWVRARRWRDYERLAERAEAAWAQFRVERSALLRSIGSAWGLIPELCEIVDSYGRAVTDADFHAAEAEQLKRQAEWHAEVRAMLARADAAAPQSNSAIPTAGTGAAPAAPAATATF